MFLADSAIIDLQRIHNDLVNPFDQNRLDCGAYELTIGDEAFITAKGQQTKTTLKDREQFIIEPGQFALLITEETVHLPKEIIGFISIKSKIKLQGLVNISGFHVDPSFRGKLKFSVYNAGSQPIVLARSQRMFTIWFAELKGDIKKPYEGKSKDQKDIDTEDVKRMLGEVASPSALLKRIEALEKELKTYKIITSTILIVIVFPLVVNIISDKFFRKEEIKQPQTFKLETHKDTNQTTTKPEKKTSDTTRVPTK